MSMIRRNPMNGITWHSAMMSTTSPNLSVRMMQNLNEPTFMLDLVSILENFARSRRLISKILEECKASLPGRCFCEYEGSIYINSEHLQRLTTFLGMTNYASVDQVGDFWKFWNAQLEELMTEYPKRTPIEEPSNSIEEGDPNQECYMYAQYGECDQEECPYEHKGAQFLSPREYREAVREDKDRIRRRSDRLSSEPRRPRLPVLSGRKKSSSLVPSKRKRRDPDEEEFDPEEIEDDEEEEEKDEEMMQMIIDQEYDDDDEGDAEDDVEADYISEPQRRAMQFDERQTLIELNTQAISSLCAAGEYFRGRQEDAGERNYSRVLEEIDSGVTNAVNELQAMIPVGNRQEIQVQDVLGDEYLESAVRMTQRVTELGYSLRDLDREEFGTMMKEVGIRASNLHRQVYGKKPKKVAMGVGRGGRKYFNYYSRQTAPRTLDVAIGEWFRNRERNAADRTRAATHHTVKRPKMMSDFEISRNEQEEDAEFNALIREAEENQVEEKEEQPYPDNDEDEDEMVQEMVREYEERVQPTPLDLVRKFFGSK